MLASNYVPHSYQSETLRVTENEARGEFHMAKLLKNSSTSKYEFENDHETTSFYIYFKHQVMMINEEKNKLVKLGFDEIRLAK